MHGPRSSDATSGGRPEAACTLLSHCVARAGVGGDSVPLPSDPRVLPNLTAGAALAFLSPDLVLQALDSPSSKVRRVPSAVGVAHHHHHHPRHPAKRSRLIVHGASLRPHVCTTSSTALSALGQRSLLCGFAASAHVYVPTRVVVVAGRATCSYDFVVKRYVLCCWCCVPGPDGGSALAG